MSAQRPLCVVGRWGEVRSKRAGYDGNGKERKQGLFPLSLGPRATDNFRFAIFTGVPCGGLYGGERARKQQRENKVCLSIND